MRGSASGSTSTPPTRTVGEHSNRCHHDQLGSTRALTDQDGQPIPTYTYTYTPYGTLKTITGAATNPFGGVRS